MVEPKEIRIGNLVTDKFYPDFQAIILVESVHEKGINVSAVDSNEPYGLHSAMLECEHEWQDVYGIPLNDEWLWKLGFEYLDYRNKWQMNGFAFQLQEEIKGEWHILFALAKIDVVPLRYVHQLQNLYFMLTGKVLQQ